MVVKSAVPDSISAASFAADVLAKICKRPVLDTLDVMPAMLAAVINDDKPDIVVMAALPVLIVTPFISNVRFDAKLTVDVLLVTTGISSAQAVDPTCTQVLDAFL